jgi:fatty-acyl-CoA synthase
VLTLADFVRLNSRRNPDVTAVVDDEGRLTHGQLSTRAWALAQGLIRLGVHPGDRVAVLSQNSIFAVETYLGVLAAGAVYVPFNWRWAPPELAYAIDLTSPSVLLVEGEFHQLVRETLDLPAHRPTVVDQHDGYDSLLGDPVDPQIALSPEDPAVILFTGGTTGFSKGVVLPHRAILFNAINEMMDLGFGGPGQVGLSIVPLYHSASLLCVFGPHYMAGGTSVVVRKFTEEGFAEVVEREHVTSTFIIPNMIRRLLASGTLSSTRVRTLRQLHTGGGVLRMPDKLAVKSALPDVQLFFRYGLTEAGPMVSRLKDIDILDPELDGSIGQEYTFTEVQLRDLEGMEVGPGELGEIFVRGPGVMLGYYNQADATNDVLGDDWLRTGDLAVRDERGYLYFRDRAKDMIKSGGENVYAAEIEQLLYAHPAVMECAVVGVPSLEWDEEVRAVVALREGATLDAVALESYLRESLAGYKIPKVFLFVDPGWMPINPSGKIVKKRLRDKAGW